MDQPVSIVAASPTPTAVIRETTTWERFPTLWRELLDEVWGYVRAAGVQGGRNVMVYLDDAPNVEVGVELDGPLAEPAGRIVASGLPQGRAATTIARGAPSPDAIAGAHAAVIDWCDANGHTRTGVRWEIYGHWRDDPDSFEIAVYWLLAA